MCDYNRPNMLYNSYGDLKIDCVEAEHMKHRTVLLCYV